VSKNDCQNWKSKAQAGGLLAGEVHVWRLPVALLAGWAIDHYKILTAPEQEKIERKHRREDAEREAVARVGLRVLLSGYLGEEAGKVVFATEAKGKPVLAKSPGRDPRVEFNLSHSGAWVMMACARGVRLGIDVEQHREIDQDDLVSGFFSAPERASWATIPPVSRLPVFFEAWTRKESYLKGVGVGLMKALDSFAVELAPGAMPAILWDDADPRAGVDWRLRSVSPQDGYAATLAVAMPREPRLETFTFAPP
jgi:4'-phosphopantetheinyl transferase